MARSVRPAGLEQLTEGRRGARGGRAVWAARLPHDGEAIVDEPIGLIELRLIDSQQAERDQALPDVECAIAVQGAVAFQRGLQQRVRLIEAPELLIESAERAVQVRLHGRLGIERARFLRTAIDQRQHAQIVGGAGRGVSPARTGSA